MTSIRQYVAASERGSYFASVDESMGGVKWS
jgi:hypothetical protein